MSFYFISFECPFHKIPILNRYERPCSQDRISGTGPGGRVLPFMPSVAPFRVTCRDSRHTPASSSGVAAVPGAVPERRTARRWSQT